MTINISDINEEDAPTPISDAYQHVSNMGEFLVLFSGGLGLSFLALHSRSFEIVLGVVYIAGITYLALQFEEAKRATTFRAVAITMGVVLGFREIFMLFPTTVLRLVIFLLGSIILLLLIAKWVRGVFSQ